MQLFRTLGLSKLNTLEEEFYDGEVMIASNPTEFVSQMVSQETIIVEATDPMLEDLNFSIQNLQAKESKGDFKKVCENLQAFHD